MSKYLPSPRGWVAEQDRLWPIAVEAFPRYELYQDNAGQAGRVIPVFVAEPDRKIEAEK